MKQKSMRNMIVSTIGLVIVASLRIAYAGFLQTWLKTWKIPALTKSLPGIQIALDVFLWIVLSAFIVNFLNVFVWNWFFEKRLKKQVPKILQDIIAVFIVSGIVISVLSNTFNFSVSGLLATSGVVGIVLGFALQSMLSDVFAGIALNIEQPYRIGDYIELDNGLQGKVIEINWRTTVIQPLDAITTIVPNGKIGSMAVMNFTRPHDFFRMTFELYLNHNVPTERAIRILLAGVKAVEERIPGVASAANILGVDEVGVRYGVFYWVTTFTRLVPTRTRVIASIMRHLYQAGIAPVHSKHDVYVARMPTHKLSESVDLSFILARIDLFKPFAEEDYEVLAKALAPQSLPAGTPIVTQDESGDSLFIIVEGLLSVLVKGGDGKGDITVAKIEPGEFFGEFSLLTGEKRNATVITVTESVIYEITKEHISPFLEKHPELIHHLSGILAERKMKRTESIDTMPRIEQEKEKEELSKHFFGKISNFFSSWFEK